MKLQDIRLVNGFKTLLSSIHKIYYIYARLTSILAYLTIFITMLKKILLVENFANSQSH